MAQSAICTTSPRVPLLALPLLNGGVLFDNLQQTEGCGCTSHGWAGGKGFAELTGDLTIFTIGMFIWTILYKLTQTLLIPFSVSIPHMVLKPQVY